VLLRDLENREHSIGVSVSETNSDTSTPTVTTTANDSKKRATMPSRNSTAPKIDTSVRLAAMTAKPTCSVPSIAAVRRSRSATLAAPVDVLEHDDRVVDDDAISSSSRAATSG